MSWSISVSAVPRSEFDAAVDAIDSSKVTQGSAETVGLSDAVDAAKAAMKSLAGQLKRDKIGGGASGHCLQPNEGAMSDSISVNVYGV